MRASLLSQQPSVLWDLSVSAMSAVVDDAAAQLKDMIVSASGDDSAPLTAEEIEDYVFAVSKGGLNGRPVSELQSYLAADPPVITVRDEKGWTPLLWGAFHGHSQVRGGVAHTACCCREQLAQVPGSTVVWLLVAGRWWPPCLRTAAIPAIATG